MNNLKYHQSQYSLKRTPLFFIAFVILFFLIILLSLLSLNLISDISDQTNNLYQHPYTVATSTLKIQANIIRMHRSMKDVSLAKNKQELNDAISIVKKYELDIFNEFTVIKLRYLGNPEDVDRALMSFKNWKAIRDEVIQLMRVGKKIKASDITKGKGAEYVKSLNKTISEFTVFAQNKANSFLEKSKRSNHNAYATILTVITATLLSGVLVVIAYYYSNKEINESRSKLKIINDNLEKIVDNRTMDLIKMNLTLEKQIEDNQNLQNLSDINEQKYDITFEKANIGIAHIAVDGSWLKINEQIVRLFGYTKDEILQLSLDDITLNEDKDIDRKLYYQALKGNRSEYKTEKRFIHKDGKIIWAALSVTLVRKLAQEIQFFIYVIEDLTHKKEAEQRMLSSSIFNAVNSCLSAVYIISLEENKYKYINESYTRILGYTLTELKKINKEEMLSYYHPNDQKNIVANFKMTYSSDQGKASEIRYRFRHKLGHWVWCHSRETILERDSSNKPISIIGILLDISSIMEIEVELKSNLNQLQTIFHNSGLGIELIRLNGDIIEHNDTIAKMLGYSTNETFNLATISDEAHIDDIKIEKAFLKEIQNNQRKSFAIKKRYRTKGGNYLWTMLYLSAIEENAMRIDNGIIEESVNEDRLAVGIIQDISKLTELEENEEKRERLYGKILDNTKDAIVLFDRKLNHIIVNKAYSDMQGIHSEDLISNSSNMAFAKGFFNNSFKEYCDRAIDEGEIYYEEWLETYAKGKIYASIHITPFIGEPEKGEIEGLILSMRDLTDKHKMQLENKKQEQLLLQQSKLAAMGEMIGAIAHQWRQPLSAVAFSLLNIKEAEEYNDLTKEYLNNKINDAEKSLVFMSKTIDDFRNFYTLSKEKIAFSVEEAVRESINIVSAQMNSFDIQINMNILGDKVKTKGYPGEFKQVILNLLSNSRDAINSRVDEAKMDRGQGKIEIEISSAKDLIRTIIIDNGGGITKDYLDRIFEPYFTTKEQDKGTGIGLYMSKLIIEDNMKGRLTVDNTEDGAAFIIELAATD